MSNNVYDDKILGLKEEKIEELEEQLKKVHEKMGDTWNTDNGIKKEDPFYLTKGEQLAVRVFKHL